MKKGITIDFPKDLERAAAAAGMKLTIHPRDCGGKCKDCQKILDEFARKIAEEEDRIAMEQFSR